jgi:hypothetical protein
MSRRRDCPSGTYPEQVIYPQVVEIGFWRRLPVSRKEDCWMDKNSKSSQKSADKNKKSAEFGNESEMDNKENK